MDILGIGTALPRFMVDQKRAAEIAKTYSCETPEQARLLPVLYRRSGVRQRGSVVVESYDGTNLTYSLFEPLKGHDDHGPTTAQRMERYAIEAGPLAVHAAREALGDAGVEPEAITHLVTVSCTGFSAPGVDVHLIRALGLRPTVERTHVGFMGCHGALNGLRVAAALAAAVPDARILLAAVEICSLHYHYGWDPEMVVANALFADGAAAVVGGPRGSGGPRAWRVIANGSCLVPDSEDAMTWRIVDHGFRMTLSARVPGLIEAHLPRWASEWLGAHGLTFDRVGSWAIHPGGPRIVDSVARALTIPESLTRISDEILADHGNMSSPTVVFILDRLRKTDAPRPCVAMAFGPGLIVEATLFA